MFLLNMVIIRLATRNGRGKNKYISIPKAIQLCYVNIFIQGVSGGIVSILGGGSMDCSK